MKPRKSCNNCAWAALALAALAGNGVCQSVTLTGQVTETLHGKPLPKATVTLRPRQASSRAALTNVYTSVSGADGSFRIANMLDGSYTVTLSAVGYVLPARPDGTAKPIPPLTVKPGEQRTLALQMMPAGVISGRVVDLEGDPVRAVQVQAMQYLGNGNQRELASRVSAISNDRGEYRLYGLVPGAYYVQATVRNSGGGSFVEGEKIRGPRPPTGFVSTFYPSIRDESASAPVRVAPGEELANIDIRLQSVVLYSVRVRMRNPPQRETHAQFTLFDRGTNRNIASVLAIGDIAEFRSVLPGSYGLMGTVQSNDGGLPRAYTHRTVEVADHDIEVDAPPFTPPFDLTGTVHLDAAAPFPFQKMRIEAQGQRLIGPLPMPATVMAADGTFAIHNVVQDEYTLSVNVPAGAYLKSIKLGDSVLPDLHIDLSSGPATLTVLLATDGGHIKGVVENAAGGSAPRTVVRLYPEGAMSDRDDRVKSTTTNEDGRYELADIAPGDYRLYAWDRDDVRPQRDPDFRKTYAAQSVAVTVAPSSTQVLSLKAISLAH